jgi:hypothetical protein
MSDTTPRTSAWLTAQRVMEETGLSPAELAALANDEYARLTGRPTLRQVAQDAYAATPLGRPQPATQATPQPPTAAPGIDLDAIDWDSLTTEEYAHLRAKVIQPKTTHGGAQNGRHPLLTAGVEAPRHVQTDYSARDAETARMQALNADRQAAIRRQGYGF